MRKFMALAVLAFAMIATPALANDRPPGNDQGLPGCEPSHNTPKKCDHNGDNEGDHGQCPTMQSDRSSMRDHQMCCDGDNDADDVGCPPVTPPGGGIVVVPEPAGANCTAGGVKITVGDEVFFVCNGVPGVQGPAGPAGPAGPQGPAGAPGQTPTVTVTQGPGPNQITITVNGVPTVITIPLNVSPKPCVNTRKSAILGALPRQFKVGMRVSVTTKGHTQFRTVGDGRKVRVNTSNLPCGVYAIAVRSVNHPKLRAAWRIWAFTGGKTLNRFWFPGAPFVSTF